MIALRCRRATINVTHFVALAQALNEDELEKFYDLSAGMLMKRGHCEIDWLLPVRLERDNGAVVFSMIAVQAKHFRAGTNGAAVRAYHGAIAWTDVFLRDESGLAAAPPPFISLIASIRETGQNSSHIMFQCDTHAALGQAAITCTLRNMPAYHSVHVRRALEAMVGDEDLVETMMGRYGSVADRSWKDDVIRAAEPAFHFE